MQLLLAVDDQFAVSRARIELPTEFGATNFDDHDLCGGVNDGVRKEVTADRLPVAVGHRDVGVTAVVG